MNARDKDGSTSLHLASLGRVLETVRLLIEHGANVDADDNLGRTALQITLKEGHHDIADKLSDHSSKRENN